MPKPHQKQFFTITELTREFGVSTRTLRFYEDEGLLYPERRGRTRLFRPADRSLLAMIMRGKRLGFSISEIRDLLAMYRERPGSESLLRQQIERIDDKRATLKQKRSDIDATLAELDQVEEACLSRIAELKVGS